LKEIDASASAAAALAASSVGLTLVCEPLTSSISRCVVSLSGAAKLEGWTMW